MTRTSTSARNEIRAVSLRLILLACCRAGSLGVAVRSPPGPIVAAAGRRGLGTKILGSTIGGVPDQCGVALVGFGG